MTQGQYDYCRREVDHIMKHVSRVARLVEENGKFTDILIDLSKARSAVADLSKELLSDHVGDNMEELVRKKDTESIEKLRKLITTYVK